MPVGIQCENATPSSCAWISGRPWLPLWVISAIFLGQLYGVEVGFTALVWVLITAVLISFSVPGIPSGSLFLVAPVLVELGLPAEGVGLLIALDVVPDMFKTTLNVTGHMATAAVLTQYEAKPS